jgi:DNA-binding transcriptional LysR family regulator
MRLDIESLRTFRALIETGSVTNAAAQLHLTQSAVSWKMKRLEERIGATLVTRNGRELILSEIGVELLEHAELLVSAHDVAVDSLQRSQLKGTVHLGMNDEPDANDVAGLLARFKRRHPMVRLQVKMGQSDPIAQQLRGGQLDIALIQTLKPEEHDQILWTESLHWLSAPGFLLPNQEAVPLVGFGPNCLYRSAILSGLQAAGLGHYSAFEGESSQAVRNAIVAGFGVGVLNERSLSKECKPWTHPGLDQSLPQASFVLRVNSRSRSSAVRALVDEIAESTF